MFEVVLITKKLFIVVFQVLVPGGEVLLRDYAVDDMAQKRFEMEAQDKDPNKLDDNFYVRGDGTRAFFFSQGNKWNLCLFIDSAEKLEELFTKCGYEKVSCELVKKLKENKKEEKKMHRVWIQAVFKKPQRTDNECR